MDFMGKFIGKQIINQTRLHAAWMTKLVDKFVESALKTLDNNSTYFLAVHTIPLKTMTRSVINLPSAVNAIRGWISDISSDYNELAVTFIALAGHVLSEEEMAN